MKRTKLAGIVGLGLLAGCLPDYPGSSYGGGSWEGAGSGPVAASAAPANAEVPLDPPLSQTVIEDREDRC